MINKMSKMIKSGQEYMQIWPMQRQLYPIFPECKIIQATRLGFKTTPPIAAFAIVMQIGLLGPEMLPQAVAMAVLIVSLPLQGVIWLGKRSQQELPPAMLSWYKDIYTKMAQQGCVLNHASKKPRFKELAVLLKKAFSELDRAFTKDLF